MRRRSWLQLAALSSVVGSAALANDAQAKPDEVPPLALDLVIAEFDGEPVVSEAWVDRQVAEAIRLMTPHGVSVAQVDRRTLGSALAELENANDRDAVAEHLHPRAINAFFVKSLRDVDKPDRFIRGVRWRHRRDLRKDYVIVSSIAGPLTLCHELGHFLGNGHSQVVNNVMSYKHEDYDKIAFDKAQGAKMRQVARRLLATKKVLSASDYEAERDRK
jgi:hypothetical protein